MVIKEKRELLSEVHTETISFSHLIGRLHWYLGALCVMAGDFGFISVICFMIGRFVDEVFTWRVYL